MAEQECHFPCTDSHFYRVCCHFFCCFWISASNLPFSFSFALLQTLVSSVDRSMPRVLRTWLNFTIVATCRMFDLPWVWTKLMCFHALMFTHFRPRKDNLTISFCLVSCQVEINSHQKMPSPVFFLQTDLSLVRRRHVFRWPFPPNTNVQHTLVQAEATSPLGRSDNNQCFFFCVSGGWGEVNRQDFGEGNWTRIFHRCALFLLEFFFSFRATTRFLVPSVSLRHAASLIFFFNKNQKKTQNLQWVFNHLFAAHQFWLKSRPSGFM